VDVKSILAALKKQDFGPDDSVIASALMNPKEAINRGGEWIRHNVSVAGGGDPYDNPNPVIGPGRAEQAEAGLNLAGLAQFGGMPGAPSSAGGTLGTFIGPKAKGWDAKKAELAKQLLDSGADPKQVWKEHLIGKMPDGSLFSEINDRNFTLKHPDELIQSGKYSGWKDDAMNHPALFQEYPQFEYDPLQMQIGKGRGGHYDSVDNLTYAKGRTPEEIANVLLHENQHAIQGVEGWATGGSPANTPGFDIDAVMRIKDHVKRLGINPDDIEARLKAGQPVSLSEQERYFKYKDLVDKEKEIYKNSIPNEEAYRRLTGEAQARLTQERQPLTMQQRAEQYPLEGDKVADIPFSQLINRYGGSGDQRSLPETEFSLAHKIAQEHAALPVEQGGLGLPPDNTAMDRARALGFDTDKTWYHGTNNEFEEFDPSTIGKNYDSHYGEGFYFASQPRHAMEYGNINDYYLSANNPIKHSLSLREEAKNTGITLRDLAQQKGNDSIEQGDQFNAQRIVFDPKNIRSRFAAFDPFKKDNANILASLLLGTTLATQQDKK
jgi:hypothetical protein